MATPKIHQKVLRTVGATLRNPAASFQLIFILLWGNNRSLREIKKVYTILNYPHKCYLKGLGVRQAIELAIAHQQIYKEHFTKHKIQRLPLTLWSIILPDNSVASLVLNNVEKKYFYEGELSVSLNNNNDKLAELCFIFTNPAQSEHTSKAILLTRIQGVHEQRANNQKVAKHLKDMNTKYLLMSALSGLIEHFKIHDVYAVPAHRQPSFREHNQKNNFVDLYNTLWESYGGHLTNENLYKVPTPLTKQRNSEHSTHRSRSRHHENTRIEIAQKSAAALKNLFSSAPCRSATHHGQPNYSDRRYEIR